MPQKAAMQFMYDTETGEMTNIKFTKEFLNEDSLTQADILFDIEESLEQLKRDLEINRERKWNDTMNCLMNKISDVKKNKR